VNTIDDVLSGRARWCVVTGNCIDAMKQIPAGSVDAVVTDPPYGLKYGYASYDDTDENLVALVAGFVPLARTIAARVMIFPGVHNLWKYPPADWVASWSWRSTSHFGKFGYSMWQPILLYGKDVKGFGSVNGVLKSDTAHFPDGNGIGFLGEDRANHPCPKPERVMRWCVKRFTLEPDEIVLDPFTGSGSTGVACMQMGRRFIGVEIDEGYADIARRRIAEAANHLFQEAV
jgi:DNA modification methylase